MRNVILAVAAVLALAGYEAAACSCAPPPAPTAALEKATAVFTGKVTAMEIAGGSGMGMLVTLKAGRAWKGVESATVRLHTNRSSAACGYGFRVGGQYLVYAYASQAHGVLATNLCTRTRALSQAAGDLAELGQGNPVPED